MSKPKFVEHNGVRILVVDYSGSRGADLRQRIATAEHFVRSQPLKSLLILARAEEIEYTPAATKILLEHVTGNEPYSRATAVVGLGHLAKVVPIANRLTGRDLEAFDDEREALAWLATHEPSVPKLDEHVRFIEHKGEQILLMNFENCTEAEVRARVGLSAQMIRTQPTRSVLGLNLLHGFRFDRKLAAAMKEYVQENRPYMLAAAAVGLEHMKPVLNVLNRIAGRNIRAFDDVEAAKDWLVEEKKRLLKD